MPRGPRLDAPRALQHIMLRGIERYRLFATTADRRDFVARPLAETQTACYAWVLMPNHVHLLVRTGVKGDIVDGVDLLNGCGGSGPAHRGDGIQMRDVPKYSKLCLAPI